jgi:prepilin signal peptidase PulO-like enzyme (type II secretory pathway)
MDFIEAFYGALVGAALGSFLGAAYYRLPRRLSMTGRSHCPNCGAKLSIVDNLPVGSWLILGGKSSCCKTRISPHYFLFELAMLIAGAFAAHRFGLVTTFACSIAVVLLVMIVNGLTYKRK